MPFPKMRYQPLPRCDRPGSVLSPTNRHCRHRLPNSKEEKRITPKKESFSAYPQPLKIFSILLYHACQIPIYRTVSNLRRTLLGPRIYEGAVSAADWGSCCGTRQLLPPTSLRSATPLASAGGKSLCVIRNYSLNWNLKRKKEAALQLPFGFILHSRWGYPEHASYLCSGYGFPRGRS